MSRIYLKNPYLIIALAVLVNLLLHFAADLNSGFDGDELYHIDTGNNLAFGYMEFPPLIGLVAWIQNMFASESVIINHLFVHLSSALILIFAGLSIIKMGGEVIAIITGLTCLLVAPGLLSSQQVLQPVVFDQLFWVIGFYCLIGYYKEKSSKYLISSSVIFAIGFLTKYTILFFVGSFLISTLLVDINLYRKKVFYFAIVVFLILIIPNMAWQYFNDFPVITHFQRLYNAHLDKLTRLENLKVLIFSINPLTLPVWFTGIMILPFVKNLKQFKSISLTVVIAFTLMLLANGKHYYFFPIIILGLILGSVYLEQLFYSHLKILSFYTGFLLLLSPFVFITALPILPMESYISFMRIKQNENGVTPIMIDAYYSDSMWNNLGLAVGQVYNKLDEKERKKCLIWGDTYSFASAINLYAEKYKTPKAFSFHGTHYLWLPKFEKGSNVIAIVNSGTKSGFDRSMHFYCQFFEKVELKKQLFNRYTNDNTDYYLNIFYCQNLKYSSENMKIIMKHRIFE